MGTFRYKAKKIDSNRIVQNSAEFPSYAEAYKSIEESGYIPLSITEVNAKSRTKKAIRMNLRQVAVFCRQFSTMVSAGLTIITTFDILRNQIQNSNDKALTEVYNQLYVDVQKGLTLFEAMLAQGTTFPIMLINMVRAGEVSGNLDTVLAKSASYFDGQFKLMNKIKTSMMYPIILASLLLVVIIALFTFIMPQFFVVFETMQVDLPPITEAIIGFSDFLMTKWYYIIIGGFVVAIIYSMLLNNPKTAYMMDEIKLNTPVLKNVISKVAIARFTSTMEVLFSSGVSILESIHISTDVLSNRVHRAKLASVEKYVETGYPLAKALEEENVFEPMVVSLIAVGEESGNLEDIFNMASDFYNSQADEAIARLVGLLEPIMIVIMGAVIGVIVAAVILPTFQLSTGISAQF